METDPTQNSVVPNADFNAQPAFRNLTPLAIMTLGIASVSTLLAGAVAMSGGSQPGNRSFGSWIIPHLIVVALLSMGFRVLGDIAAVIVSLIFFFVGLLVGMLDGHSYYGGLAMNGPALRLALVQVPLLVTAISDLTKNRKIKSQSLELVDRLLGLGLPLALYLIARR